MAIKTYRVDDFDGETTEGVREVSFSLNDDRYVIDMGASSLDALKDALKPFIKKATKADATTAKPGRKKYPGIVQWAQSEGLQGASEYTGGRVPQSWKDAYDASH